MPLLHQLIDLGDIPFQYSTLPIRGAVSEGAVYQPIARTARVGLIDVRDIAAVAARVLRDSGHEGQRYVLTGPAALTFNEVCTHLSTTLHKPVRYIELTREEFKRKMLQHGQPEWFVDAYNELSAAINHNELSFLTTTVADLTGKLPRSFEQFVRDFAEQFAAPSTGRRCRTGWSTARPIGCRSPLQAGTG